MRIPACLALVILSTACGKEPPTKEEIEDARARVDLAVLAANQVRVALEVLGILPVYTCGESRRTFVGRAAEGARTKVACVTATAEALDDSSDAVVLSFPDTGCTVGGRTVSGHSSFIYKGGEDRMDVFAELRELKVDGQPLQAKVGYGTCSDEKRFWAESTGDLPGRASSSYSVNANVGVRDGVPIFGGTTLVLNGPGEVTGSLGTDRVTFSELQYEVGEYLPKKGEALIETAKGHQVRVNFSEVLWRLGKVEVEIDDRAPITVPVIR
ncbi:hypothetical protein [Archangium lipolyticum]|uniref:hypothetical protein n=1 Tax=Archangium lipolyticum TaxID=2970465 RepID=UPI002149DF06|nr:hypothetical protein [Archangium lipolyticum]